MHDKQWQAPVWRQLRLPVRVIEAAFGRGNFDDAGDEIIAIVKELSEWPEQFQCRFNFDSSHPNPWYHVMVAQFLGMPDVQYVALVERLARIGLHCSS